MLRQNEKGFTLTEILAGIVLLSITTTLTTIILVNIFDSNKTAASEATIKQDTNVMMSQLRSEFYNSDKDTTEICLDDQNGRVKIEKVQIKPNEDSKRPANVKYEGGNCLKIDKPGVPINKYPIKLYVQTSDPNKESRVVDIDTTLVKGHQLVFDDVQEIAGKPCDVIPKVESATNSSGKLPCSSKGDVIWNGEDADNKDKNNKTCEKYVVNGNLQIDGEINGKFEDIDLEVRGNLYSKNQAHLKDGKLHVYGNAYFKEQPNFLNEAKIDIEGGACFNNRLEIHRDSVVTVKGNSTIRGDETDLGGTLKIGGSLNLEDPQPLQLMDTGKLVVVGDAHFKGVDILDNSSMSVRGHVYSKDAPFRHLSNEDVFIYKDTNHKHSTKKDGDGKYCVKGKELSNKITQTLPEFCSYPDDIFQF